MTQLPTILDRINYDTMLEGLVAKQVTDDGTMFRRENLKKKMVTNYVATCPILSTK